MGYKEWQNHDHYNAIIIKLTWAAMISEMHQDNRIICIWGTYIAGTFVSAIKYLKSFS